MRQMQEMKASILRVHKEVIGSRNPRGADTAVGYYGTDEAVRIVSEGKEMVRLSWREGAGGGPVR